VLGRLRQDSHDFHLNYIENSRSGYGAMQDPV
jgi:hypothetical protein